MSETTRWTKATERVDMWADASDDPREAETAGTDERSILLDYLRRYRLTMELKCADLDAEQLARRGPCRRRRCPCSGWCGTWPSSNAGGSGR